MITPTELFLLEKEKLRKKKTIIQQNGGYPTERELFKKTNNGEDSLVRSRMAGCGSALSSFTERRNRELRKEEKCRPYGTTLLCKNLAGQNLVDPSSMPFFSFPKEKTRLPKEKRNANGGTNLGPRSFLSFFFYEKKKSKFAKKKNVALRDDFATRKSTALQIIKLLSQKALTQKQLAQRLGLTARAVRYILSDLIRKGIIVQRTSLFDARQSFYEVENCTNPTEFASFDSQENRK